MDWLTGWGGGGYSDIYDLYKVDFLVFKILVLLGF